MSASQDFLTTAGASKFRTILADPPWRFQNKTGKVAPGHKRLHRYATMTLDEIKALPVAAVSAETAHLYLWAPNALLPQGLEVMKAWGFRYKSNIVWHKVRKDGGSDGRGVGFYFRNVTEILLFGVRGRHARTLPPGRTQVNLIATRKREHSRKPDEQYVLIEACSSEPRLELFSRGLRKGWTTWGDQAHGGYAPTWSTYSHNSASDRGDRLPARRGDMTPRQTRDEDEVRKPTPRPGTRSTPALFVDDGEEAYRTLKARHDAERALARGSRSRPGDDEESEP